MKLTTAQILTQNVKYLMDVIGDVATAAQKFYSKGDQTKQTTGAYYDFTINPVTKLPEFPDGKPLMNYTSQNSGGEDLTPTIELLQSQLSATQKQLNELSSTVKANKNSADASIGSLQGSISSLDTRISALEAG